MPNLPGYGAGKLPARKPAAKPKKPVKRKPVQPQKPAAPTVREQSPLGLAQSLVRQEMAPYYQQVSQAQAEQEAYERRRQQAIQGFTQALIGQIQGDPGRISADYEHAISQQSGLAAQSAAALGAASTAPASQQLLGAVGAPPEQQAQMAAGLAATFQGGGGVMQHTQGTIPGQTFSGQQLAQLAYARGMPSIAASRGFGALSEALGLSADERRELRNKRLEIAAQEPGLIEKTRAGIIEGRARTGEAREKSAYQQATLRQRQQEAAFNQAYKVEGMRQKDRALAYQQYAFERSMGLKASKETFNQWEARQGLKLKAVSTKQRDRSLNLQERSLQQRQLQNDRQFQLSLDRLGIQDQALRHRIAEAEWKRRHTGKKGGFTAGQLAKKRAEAGQTAQRAYNGYWANPDDSGTPLTAAQLRQYLKDHDTDDPAEAGLGFFKASYQETLLDLLNLGVPLVTAQSALNRYWKPGQTMPWESTGQGRPKQSIQKRRKKR